MANLFWKLFDGPLAIVVGSVALVLAVVQLTAVSALAGDALGPSAAGESPGRSRQLATLQCLESSDRARHADCLLQVAERRPASAEVRLAR